MGVCKSMKALMCIIILVTIFSVLSVNSYAASYDDNDIMYSDKANDLLCTLSKRNYYKAYDGWALVAYYYCSTGYSGPILVSDKAENVAFTTTWDKKILTYGGTITYNGKTWYYSSTEYFMPGNLKNTGTNTLYKCNNGNQISVQNAALELLKKYLVCDGKYREHQDVREVAHQDATCTTNGKTVKKCLTCNTIVASEEIPATGHAYGAFVVDREASCMEEGIQHQICRNCGYTNREIIAKSDHSFSDWNVVSGSKLIPPIVKERKCINCKYEEQIKDWGYIWVTILVAIASVGVVIGLIGYIRAFRKK